MHSSSKETNIGLYRTRKALTILGTELRLLWSGDIYKVRVMLSQGSSSIYPPLIGNKRFKWQIVRWNMASPLRDLTKLN